MSCENCSYYSYAGKWSKGYCSYYKTYTYANESCEHETQSGTTGCFIKLAAAANGFAPDSRFVNTIRAFRDRLLPKFDGGRKAIEEYYALAPAIVDHINSDPQREMVLSKIFHRLQACVTHIQNNENTQAFNLYKETMAQLKKRYLNA